MDEYQTPEQETPVRPVHEILADLMENAYSRGVMTENSVVYQDLFDTKLMGALVPAPSTVIRKFRELYEESPKAATNYYYKLSCDTNYIRRDRIKRDVKWTADTEYGTLDITINLSKPEKDPKAIAAAKNAPQSAYPKCLLCKENEGYAGRVNHPARQNHRVIPVTIDGGQWGLQYSPYVYYNEHCILFNSDHIPMKIDESAFRKLLDFVRQFPHYFVGSNADLPIVGGSILAHEHFQGGHYEFAMERADIKQMLTIPDEDAFIYAQTDGEPHNTITPIARMRDGEFELDLVLRNNITTPEYPLGVYHPHQELHHIKKENIGLIEVMGLAVLPARLKGEMQRLGEYIISGKDIRADEELAKHADWVDEFLPKYDAITEDNVDEILQTEIGIVFKKVLEHAGVYKNTDEGMNAFMRFILSL